jgi:hypothetical protein
VYIFVNIVLFTDIILRGRYISKQVGESGGILDENSFFVYSSSIANAVERVDVNSPNKLLSIMLHFTPRNLSDTSVILIEIVNKIQDCLFTRMSRDLTNLLALL